MKRALFNINRLLDDSGNDTPVEVSFLNDLDYTLRKMNEHTPHYYFKEVSKETHPDLFEPGIHVVCWDVLPEKCTQEQVFNDKNPVIYHTNDQKYWIGVYSNGKPSKTYKPSSLKCMRDMYYQVIGADLDKQSEKSGDFYGICESGTDRHERIQSAISKMSKYGVECEYVDVAKYVEEHNLTHLEVISKTNFETKLRDSKRNIVFLCDGIICYKGKYYILECKTESSHKWMPRQAVDDSHKYQAWTYSLEFGIDDVLFLYENRDLCTKKPYMLHVSQEDRDFIDNRIKSCDEYVAQRVAPPVQNIDKKVCQYCNYKTQCKLDGR